MDKTSAKEDLKLYNIQRNVWLNQIKVLKKVKKDFWKEKM